MKTQEEVEYLKRDWMNDPCYDLEETEGFEDHKQELLEFSEKMKEQWEMNRRTRLEQIALGLGIDDNLKLVAFLEMLQNRIIELEHKINN